MGFKCGIVGLPNVGKSTLFNCLTQSQVPAANYPFCTIDPNVGTVALPDERLDAIAKLVKPLNILPTTVEFVDIAGLVRGAAKGEGLGNQFLSHIRETDAIIHVVRCFEDRNIVHVESSLSDALAPERDIDIIETELALADLDTVNKALLRTQKAMRAGDVNAKTEYHLLERLYEALNGGMMARALSFNKEEMQFVKTLHLITLKPILYVANIADTDHLASDLPLLEMVRTKAVKAHAEVMGISAAIEAEIAQLATDEKQLFLDSLQLKEPGLNRLIRAAYRLLNLQTYFTAGEKEVRAWTIPMNCLAPEAAGVIHSDFEKGFIRAEVVAYEDFITYGGLQGAKDKGKWRLEGKDYIVKDGDIMHFRFNV